VFSLRISASSTWSWTSSIWNVRPSPARRDSAATTSEANCSTISCTRRDAPAVFPSTARNAFVMATAIFPESNGETLPLRRIICMAGSLGTPARDSGRNRMMGAEAGSACCRFKDIGWPRDAHVAGWTGREGTLQKCPAAIHRTAHASDRRTPRPWTFFVRRGRSPDLQVAVAPTSSQCGSRTVTRGSGATHCLQLRGQCRIFASPTRFTDFPLSHYILRSIGTVTPTYGDIRG